MATRRVRRNPSLPSAPPKRRFAGAPVTTQQERSALARVRRIAGSVNERERPFNPERAGSWRGSSRDLVVNGSSGTIKGVRLDPFTVSFLDTALWSSNDESRDDGGDPLDQNYTISDFNKESLQALAEDCARFQEENADDLAPFSDEDNGHNYWLNRNGHGAGFWDGDYPEPQATRLSDASERAGNVDLFVGDDGEIDASISRPMKRNARRQRRNGEQQRMPWGSKRAGKFEIPMVDFDWEQIDGDSNLPQYGGIIARCEGGQIDLVEIQPVREYVGDGEAAEVGYPFWTKEASFDADSLDPGNHEVQKALQSMDIDLEEIDDEQLARVIAVALMRYGHAEEGDGGWAGDKQPGEEGRANLLGSRKVRWSYAGSKRTTFAEEASGDDDDFRREVFGEEDEED